MVAVSRATVVAVMAKVIATDQFLDRCSHLIGRSRRRARVSERVPRGREQSESLVSAGRHGLTAPV